MQRIDQVEKVVAFTVRVVATLLVIGILVLIGVQIISRLLDTPIIWTEELARFALIWTTLLGCGWLAFTGNHMGLGFDKSPDLTARSAALNLAVRILSFIVVGFLSVTAFSSLSEFRGSSAALGLPTTVIYLALPIGMALWAVHELLAIVRSVMRRPAQNPLYSTATVLETE